MATSYDPFEARVRFSTTLQHLNASQTSAQKAAQFALKYASLSDDLHSCILEQLEKGNMNLQANIMHFIEHFMDMARKEGNRAYIKLMQKDICKIVDIVTPPSGEGYMNVKTIRKILQTLQQKSFLEPRLVAMLDQQLAAQESANQARLDAHMPDAPPPPPPGLAPGHIPADKERSKRLVEQRVEEDRERHKRQRELVWQKTFDEEKEDLFENTSDYGDDDSLLGQEENDMRAEGWREECQHQGNMNGNHAGPTAAGGSGGDADHGERHRERERGGHEGSRSDANAASAGPLSRATASDSKSGAPARPPSGPAAHGNGQNGGGKNGGGRRDRGGGRDRRENGGRRGR